MNGINAINPNDPIHFIDTTTKKRDVQKQEFLNKFQNVQSEQVRTHLESLYTKIVDQSEKIGERVHLSEVVKYKQLVREFLDVATKNSHKFTKQNFLDRRGRHRVYGIVKRVDRELESLTKDFLDQEVDRISIIKRLDGIRGLLVDIFM